MEILPVLRRWGLLGGGHGRLRRGLSVTLALGALSLAGCPADDAMSDPSRDLSAASDLGESPPDLTATATPDLAPDMAIPVGGVIYAQDFPGSAIPWPSEWKILGGVSTADLVSNRARLKPNVTTYSLARMGLAKSALDVDVVFSFEFKDVASQGIGFYVRQNGGYLKDTTPNGQGYAVFVEGFSGKYIGVWREIYGVEQPLFKKMDPFPTLANNVVFKVRFRCVQESPTMTRLLARIWDAQTVEPSGWDINTTDGTAQLQNVPGGFALDSWSNFTPTTPGSPKPADLFIDDIVITRAQ